MADSDSGSELFFWFKINYDDDDSTAHSIADQLNSFIIFTASLMLATTSWAPVSYSRLENIFYLQQNIKFDLNYQP